MRKNQFMGKHISSFLLKLGGWRYVGDRPVDKKYVVISVPHTSMWDFVWGKLAFSSIGEKPTIFIKKEAFFFPLGTFLKTLGAIPVDRSNGATGLVEQIIHFFESNQQVNVCITPEGTRLKVKRWKKGFYYIAHKSNVPVYLGFINYKNKTLGYGERFIPTGNIDEDIKYINKYYTNLNLHPKHPEQFSIDFS